MPTSARRIDYIYMKQADCRRERRRPYGNTEAMAVEIKIFILH
jgi:hypothetical protein